MQRKVKETTGHTPKELIMQTRLAHAELMLHDQERLIKTIALDNGFRNPNHFSARFRQTYGVSPTEYRAELLTQNAQQR